MCTGTEVAHAMLMLAMCFQGAARCHRLEACLLLNRPPHAVAADGCQSSTNRIMPVPTQQLQGAPGSVLHSARVGHNPHCTLPGGWTTGADAAAPQWVRGARKKPSDLA
jgi:hypothetical protein